MLSKNDTIELAMSADVPVPQTLVPSQEREAAAFARELGFPVVIKGEKGESARNVRIVPAERELEPAFRSLRVEAESYIPLVGNPF